MPTKNKNLSLDLQVEQDIQQAIVDNDYRLYGFQGRRMTLPGISPEQTDDVAKRCGYKLMEGTGDVLKSEQQREQRRKKLEYATLYNQKMLLLCDKWASDAYAKERLAQQRRVIKFTRSYNQ